MSDASIRLISEQALECRVHSAEDAQQLALVLRAQGCWQEVVAGLESVTVLFDPTRVTADTAMQTLSCAKQVETSQVETPDVVKIPVRYGGDDGPDLAEVCDKLGIAAAGFIEAHIASSHRVDMIGFTPGFAYVSGLDAALSVPRRGSPRPRLPAGSIGVSGGYTGIYALAGPGGWPIIGRTDQTLFDPSAVDPFVLQPGQRIVFEPV